MDTWVCMIDAPAGICEMVLESADIERMVDFYERLGLGVLLREGERVWLDAGESARIGIWTVGEKEHRDRGGSHVHFALAISPAGLDAMVERLGNSGQSFEGPVTHDGGDRSVYLSDPEGNRVELWDCPVTHQRKELMASEKQKAAARRNVKKAQAGAKKKETLKHLPKKTKTELGEEANKVRKGEAKTRKELNKEAAKLEIEGRSKMGKDELRRAISRAR
jgi:catechol-2,3-dioxygenase